MIKSVIFILLLFIIVLNNPCIAGVTQGICIAKYKHKIKIFLVAKNRGNIDHTVNNFLSTKLQVINVSYSFVVSNYSYYRSVLVHYCEKQD